MSLVLSTKSKKIVAATAGGLLLVVATLAMSIGREPQLGNGRVFVTGRVVDEEGNQLNDVKVIAERITFNNTLDPSKFMSKEISEWTVDGVFEVSCRSCVDVRVDFKKSGYFSETRHFPVPRGGQEPELRLADVIVTLEKKPTPIEMQSKNGRLKCSSSGAKMVLDLRESRGGGAYPVAPEKAVEAYPEPIAALVGELAEDGSLRRHSAPRVDRPDLMGIAPAGARCYVARPLAAM